MAKNQCTQRVWQGFHTYQCRNKAQDGKNVCHAHDPQKREARAEARRLQRIADLNLDVKDAARDQINAWVKANSANAPLLWLNFDGSLCIPATTATLLATHLGKEAPAHGQVDGSGDVSGVADGDSERSAVAEGPRPR